VLRFGGVDPSDVHPVTIGFNAVADLAAGKIDAATAFWNAEGVQLQRMGIPVREFRVDQFGAPRYPELVVATSRRSCPEAGAFTAALTRGYEALGQDPKGALDDLLEAVPDVDRDSLEAQLGALTSAHAFFTDNEVTTTADLESHPTAAWLAWAADHRLVDSSQAPKIAAGFDRCR
jgi:NitT/TauT family transport system substrate-binding protein/putative hydroxymethylpyrimidine transport system substrate-binding protein